MFRRISQSLDFLFNLNAIELKSDVVTNLQVSCFSKTNVQPDSIAIWQIEIFSFNQVKFRNLVILQEMQCDIRIVFHICYRIYNQLSLRILCKTQIIYLINKIIIQIRGINPTVSKICFSVIGICSLFESEWFRTEPYKYVNSQKGH